MLKTATLYISLLINLALVVVLAGCNTVISLDTKDRERADKLIENLGKMEQRFQSIDTRLREINANAFRLRGELSGVRVGTEKLQKQLEELRKRFFGTKSK